MHFSFTVRCGDRLLLSGVVLFSGLWEPLDPSEVFLPTSVSLVLAAINTQNLWAGPAPLTLHSTIYGVLVFPQQA